MRWICILLLVVCAACAPSVPSQRERADTADRSEAALLDRQLLQIPDVIGAYAAIHRAFTDPLTGVHSAPAASVLITIAGGADRAEIEHAVQALAPTASVAIVTAPSPSAPRHGPELLIALVAILGIALTIAWRSRPRAA